MLCWWAFIVWLVVNHSIQSARIMLWPCIYIYNYSYIYNYIYIIIYIYYIYIVILYTYMWIFGLNVDKHPIHHYTEHMGRCKWRLLTWASQKVLENQSSETAWVYPHRGLLLLLCSSCSSSFLLVLPVLLHCGGGAVAIVLGEVLLLMGIVSAHSHSL